MFLFQSFYGTSGLQSEAGFGKKRLAQDRSHDDVNNKVCWKQLQRSTNFDKL